MEVTSPRRLTARQKAEVVLALLRGGCGWVSQVLWGSQAQLFEWRDRFIEGGRGNSRGCGERAIPLRPSALPWG